jgi:hypothetical protein
MRYDDIDPQDIDPDTGRPYSNYSSPSLDASFHDHEMDVDDPETQVSARDLGVTMCSAGIPISKNPYDETDDREAWESGWREQAAHERAVRRAKIADDFGDEAADDEPRDHRDRALDEQGYSF